MSFANDGSQAPPRVRRDLNTITVRDLPAHSTGPKGDDDLYAALREAGYEGVQGWDLAGPREAGFRVCGMGKSDLPKHAAHWVKLWADGGADCGTMHLGSGYESDKEALDLLEACLEAQSTFGIPVFVELHRATITQDPWRTLQFLDRLPELRFNADLAHWYTGGEMVYGDLERRFAAIEPVLSRVRFVHGRISAPGHIQANLPETEVERERPAPDHVAHFRRLWTACAAGFLADAGPGDVLPFAPELLPPSMGYALVDDEGIERGDRWVQASLLCDLMEECFAEAAAARTH